MPALTKQTEDLRKVQALEAVKLMGMGVKKADARELFYEAYLPFPIFLFARIVRKIHVNEVPKMLYYREYFQIPSPDEGKLRRLYFEVVFRWNILQKFFAS